MSRNTVVLLLLATILVNTALSVHLILKLMYPVKMARGGEVLVEGGKYGFSVFKTTSSRLIIVSNAPSYNLPVNPSDVVNWDSVCKRFTLDSKALEMLSSNGFVVVNGRIDNLYQGYKSIADSGIPVFVTTDSVLFIYHAFFDHILMKLEEKKFIPILKKLLTSLKDELAKLYYELPENTLARNATLRNLAFITVALKLLDPSTDVPEVAEDLVDRELELILSASCPECISPIFMYNEDYTQYIPRGHYTEKPILEQYFRCMMWLGRMRFQANSSPYQPVELARLQTAQALILTYLMVNTNADGVSCLKLWEKVYLPTSFIVGESDDLNFYDYLETMKEVYGNFTPDMVNDVERLDLFRSKITLKNKAKIVSSPVFPCEIPSLAGLRFMGQRFILDGYIHQKLCYPEVAYRTMVKGLDIAAALGSSIAEKLLEEDKSKYPGYKEKLEEMKKYVANITDEEWSRNLYMGWLYTIKSLLNYSTKGYPTFMQTEAWRYKDLNTMMSSWAQLRHDTILYAKQPYAAKVSIPPKSPHPGYVEPHPILYYRLMNLANATLQGLKALNLLDEDMEEDLSRFISLLSKLLEISLKELKGEALTKEEAQLILSYGALLRSLISGLEERVKDPRIIADVFTDPNTNRVLEVGTGYFDPIIVVYKAEDGKLYCGVGLVMSYYEFTWPQSDRLTDEKWRQMLEKDSVEQPDWVKFFKVKE